VILDDFAPSDEDGKLVAAICRRLDGLPLAIEFAASRIDAFGIAGLAGLVDDRLRRLSGRRRGKMPRQQTMTATLDWSYRLLRDDEQLCLRRTAIFAGGFTVEAAAAAIAMEKPRRRSETTDRLTELVAKSLVAADVSGAEPHFRLLETTRAYALEKLRESGEQEQVARCHAEYYLDLFERAETEWENRAATEWLSEYGREIDNLRAALHWSFSPDGDTSIAVALTTAAVPLWMHLSLLDECRGRAEQALTSLAAGMRRDARRDMKLHAGLGASLSHTRGLTAPETVAAWTKALEIAEGLGDAEYQLRSLRGLWAFHNASRRPPVALALARRFKTLAASRSDPGNQLVGDQMIGVSQHYLGDQPGARHHLERVFTDHAGVDHRSYLARFPIDLHVQARVYLARVLWLQGLPDQAMRAAERSVADALAASHMLSLCLSLALGACQVALLVGDVAAAERYVGMLLDHSTRHGLTHWRAHCACHQGALAITRGDVMTGSRLLRAGIDELDRPRPTLQFFILLTTEAMGHVGQVSQGLAELDEGIEQSEQTKERWLIADLLRIKGELLLLRGTQSAATAAEDHFRQALDWARRQSALSLELRAATSLARLLRDQGHSTDAVALLQQVYNRFTEGFDSADLKVARALLDALQ
jgi:predicted ATPase